MSYDREERDSLQVLFWFGRKTGRILSPSRTYNNINQIAIDFEPDFPTFADLCAEATAKEEALAKLEGVIKILNFWTAVFHAIDYKTPFRICAQSRDRPETPLSHSFICFCRVVSMNELDSPLFYINQSQISPPPLFFYYLISDTNDLNYPTFFDPFSSKKSL